MTHQILFQKNIKLTTHEAFFRQKWFGLFYILIFLGCKEDESKIKPIVSDITESVYASGLVVSKNQYQAYATVAGTVKKIYLTEGMPVQVGSPILAISNESQEWNAENAKLAADYASTESKAGKLKEAKLMIEVSKSKLDQEELLLNRQRAIWAQNIGSKLELEQRELAFKNAQMSYVSASENYNELKKQINLSAKQARNNFNIANKLSRDYILKSMVNGELFSLNVKEGEMVNPQIPLAVLGEKNHYSIELQVDEHDITSIQTGMEVMVIVNSHKDSTFRAKVTKVNPLMNIKNKTFLIEAEFEHIPSLLYPNTSLEANILINTKKNAMLIPREYLTNESQVTLSKGTLVKVKTGLKDFKMIEIISGLSKDDELIKPK